MSAVSTHTNPAAHADKGVELRLPGQLKSCPSVFYLTVKVYPMLTFPHSNTGLYNFIFTA